MLSLNEIKLYLRVDGNDEDTLITQLELYSREEIENSTGFAYKEENVPELYKMAQLYIINDRYENRGSQDLEFKANNILSCLYRKLKCLADEKVTEDAI